MLDASAEGGFGPPDLSSFCRLDRLGLVVTGQRPEPDRAVLACRVVADDPGRMGGHVKSRSTINESRVLG